MGFPDFPAECERNYPNKKIMQNCGFIMLADGFWQRAGAGGDFAFCRYKSFLDSP
jgi:hypothetical protein